MNRKMDSISDFEKRNCEILLGMNAFNFEHADKQSVNNVLKGTINTSLHNSLDYFFEIIVKLQTIDYSQSIKM